MLFFLVGIVSATPQGCEEAVYEKVLIHPNSAIAFASASVDVAEPGEFTVVLCNILEHQVGRLDVSVAGVGFDASFESLSWAPLPAADPPPQSPTETASTGGSAAVAAEREAAIAEATRAIRELRREAAAAEMGLAVLRRVVVGYDAVVAAMMRTDAAMKENLTAFLSGIQTMLEVRAAEEGRVTNATLAFEAVRAAQADAEARLRALNQEKVAEAVARANVTGTRAARVTLHATTAGTVRLTLRHSAGMRWTPQYEISVDTASSTAELQYFARVSYSGTPMNCAITLSTGAHTESGAVPKLAPMLLEVDRPEDSPPSDQRAHTVPATAATTPTTASTATRTCTRSAQTASPPTQPARQTQMRAASSADVFELAGRHTVDGPGLYPVAKLPLPARVERLVVPKLSPHVYVEAVVVNTSPFTLPVGPVRLFVDGSLEARSVELPVTAPFAGEIRFKAGVDNSFRVGRFVTRTDAVTTRFLQESHTARRVRCNITLSSTRPAATALVVRDHVPLASSAASLTVTLVTPAFSPAPELVSHALVTPITAKVEGGTVALLPEGMLEWKVAVEGAGLTLAVEYVVGTPAHETVTQWDL